jgi:mRNA interferase RelE/StbE
VQRAPGRRVQVATAVRTAARRLTGIAEVWAVGAGSDSQAYAEMDRRIAALGAGPVRTSLEAVVRGLGRAGEGRPANGIAAGPLATAPSAPEQWLVDRLVHTAGLDPAAVLAMTSEQAVDAWTEFITHRR